MTYREVSFIETGKNIITTGLNNEFGYEFNVYKQAHDKEDYLRVLKYLVDYLIEHNPKLEDKQTITFSSWLLQLNKEGLYYNLWEVKQNGDGFVEGVDYSLKILKEQEEECEKLGVIPIFPTFGQKIVISKGVYEGYGVDAVRYPSPDHMCGWWVTTELYNDDIDTLMNVHYYHVAFKRPDIIKYFALPYGYRFYITTEEKDIWFDEEVLADE